MSNVISKERHKKCHVCRGTKQIKQMVKGVEKLIACPACGGKGERILMTK